MIDKFLEDNGLEIQVFACGYNLHKVFETSFRETLDIEASPVGYSLHKRNSDMSWDCILRAASEGLFIENMKAYFGSKER